MSRLKLPSVTLCAATSVNVEATVAALRRCQEQIDFADTLLFTDQLPASHSSALGIVQIERLRSSKDYSWFLLGKLADHIETEFCLVVQWDGFVLDSSRWDPAFLTFDYIGAPWPQFRDGQDVGNGGFSLRSRRLLDACRDPDFQPFDPEDLAICRTNRRLLESRHGIRFADRMTAASFSLERGRHEVPTFGFHGVFNMIPLLGADAFWQVYEGLDHRGPVFHDLKLLLRQLRSSDRMWQRRAGLLRDRTLSWLNA